jgi:hypothetical protein
MIRGDFYIFTSCPPIVFDIVVDAVAAEVVAVAAIVVAAAFAD